MQRPFPNPDSDSSGIGHARLNYSSTPSPHSQFPASHSSDNATRFQRDSGYPHRLSEALGRAPTCGEYGFEAERGCFFDHVNNAW